MKLLSLLLLALAAARVQSVVVTDVTPSSDDSYMLGLQAAELPAESLLRQIR